MDQSNPAIDFLKPESCVFTINKNGFLILTFNGEKRGRVKLTRSYPYTMPDKYICVTDLEDAEIGIIEDINALDCDSRDAAKAELTARYYCPVIAEIKSIKEKMGNFYFETVIDGKDKNFAVRNITRNIRFADDKTIFIFDMDGNRYLMPDFSAIDQKSRRLLEPYLY